MLRFSFQSLRRARALLLASAAILVAALPHAVLAQADEQLPSWQEGSSSSEAQAENGAPRSHRPTLSPSDAQLMGADVDLQRWDADLRQVQRQTRAYLASWTIGQSALIGVNVYIAMNADSEARRTGFTIASGLSAANLLYLLVQGWPALGSHKHFRNMPSSTLQEKVAKATYAEETIRAQHNKDRMASTIERHIGAFVVGIGSGLGIGLAYGDLYEALSLGIGVIGVAELLMLTRPGNYHAPERRPTFALQNVGVTPWADKNTRGIGLSARF